MLHMDLIQRGACAPGITFYFVISLVLLFFALAISPAFGDIYRWVDSEGKIHFSDRPAPTSALKLPPLELRLKPEAIESHDPEDAKRKNANRHWFRKQSKQRVAQQRIEDSKRQRWLRKQKQNQIKCRKARNRWHIAKAQHKQQRRQGITVANDIAYKKKLEILALKTQMACK